MHMGMDPSILLIGTSPRTAIHSLAGEHVGTRLGQYSSVYKVRDVYSA